MTSPDSVLDKVDPGDEVALRFDYQHCYAAMNAVHMVTNETVIVELICENHEDILIRTPHGKFIGKQIKTRALSQSPFKSNDAQIRSALVKFCTLDKRFPESFEGFDLTTNHSFWKEAESTNNLPWILDGIRCRNGSIKGLRSKNPLRQFVEQIAVDAALAPAEVAATLQKTVARAHESDISSIRGNVREALSECPGVGDLPYFTVVRIVDAIITLARNASMKKLKGPITDLYAPGNDLAKVIEDQQLEGKRITRADVLAVIDHFKSSELPYQDLDLKSLIPPSDAPADLLRAFRKLANGGVEATRVQNTEDFVRSFEALFVQWSRQYGVDEARKRYNNILGAVQLEATEAQTQASKSGEPYGSAMYANLVDRLKSRSKQDADQLYGCRPEHLIGAAGLLTQHCKTWWSPVFDLSEEAK